MEEKSTAKELWNLNPNNPKTARKHWRNNWSEEIDLNIAQLDYLDRIQRNLEAIRFRIGFIALVLLISVVLIPFIFFVSVIGALAP